VKLIRATKNRYHFRLTKWEKNLLVSVLKLYLRIPPAHQPLSKVARLPDQESSQSLLDEALAEQRAENKKQIQQWLADPRRFCESEKGLRLSLSPAEVEWLLQVLNDVRVGSWIFLGSPDERRPLQILNETTAPHLWAIEMADYFQTRLLEALEGERSA